MVTTAASAWGIGSFALYVRLVKLVEGKGWIEYTFQAGSFVFIMGPILALLYYFERPHRALSKCPNCRSEAIKGSNATCILATGRCGWCGHEVLEREECLEPAISAMPPSKEFKKLAPEDFIARSRPARKRDGWRIVTFAVLYLAGLSPFLWHLYSAAHQSILPSRQFVALLVAWSCLSPALWLKLSRWLFGGNPFPSCPHCHATWQHFWDHMTVTVTGRCGHCAVQVLETRGDSPHVTRSSSYGGTPSSVQLNTQPSGAPPWPRSRFMELSRAGKDAKQAALPRDRKWIVFWLSSSLAVLVGSILLLKGRAVLVVPLVWYVAGIILLESFVIKRRKPPKEGTTASDPLLKTCPVCKRDPEGLLRLTATTGRCENCLNVILQDDLGQEEKAIH
ncbi:hypothetical protein [Roseimicrobium sp. ORNL1]|uniref:hypothetical protein n=1 Tax=Roseimicrobium sp. ORNL1 TaxID=2711231 RepID=UPI0013E1C647|nr:hypothetical protein [Roseimicrobium sp. ORNL1]QIF00102.1 hypothetical protein G5S37_00725 [Roseimicrobium sp. ORNL1]